MKRWLMIFSLILLCNTAAFAWVTEPIIRPTPSPTPTPTPTPTETCTVTITQADQVRWSYQGQLRFVAEVKGTAWNCTATAVRWSSAYYSSSNAGATSNVGQPYAEYNSENTSSYSVAALYPWLSAYRSYNGEYQTVTASIGNSSSTVKVIGDNVAPGSDFAHALTPVKNLATGRHDTLPFWYFLEQARANPSSASEFQRFQYVYEYQAHASAWYSRGFANLTDGVVFDPFSAINTYDGYVSVRPPGSVQITSAQLEIKATSLNLKPQAVLKAQGLQSCSNGDCIGVGGVFLGYQDRGSLWSYSSFDGFWQHAAIKRSPGRFTEAPGIGFPVRTAVWNSVVGRYHRRQAYLDVNFSGAIPAAEWAVKQERKPYSLNIFDTRPVWEKRGQDVQYKGFYCSQLIWAAWYHSVAANIVSDSASTKAGAYILPNQLWSARNENKLLLRADMTDLP
jgi:hypothetical protein